MRDYFDLRDDNEITIDDEGELASLKRMQEEAARSLADMAVVTFDDHSAHEMAIEVRDENGSRSRLIGCGGSRQRQLAASFIFPDVACWPIVLQNSFRTGVHKFCGLEVRLSGKDVRHLIVSSQTHRRLL
jgi:hypothetical protein